MLIKKVFLITVFVAAQFLIASNGITADDRKKDPTRPSAFMVKQEQVNAVPNTDFVLSAIFTRNAKKYAVVNGEVLAQNDVIGNKRVVLITQTNLILEDTEAQEEALILELFSSTTVKTQVTQ